MLEELESKIERRTAVVGIVGLGYVGLPLALAFSKEFHVVGLDKYEKVVNALRNGHSHIGDISDEDVAKAVRTHFHPTIDYSDLGKCDFVIVCVPTPLRENNEPDLEDVKDACRNLSRILRKGMFVVIESTTYPGTTDGIARAILEEGGLVAGRDFGLAFSPERIDPGNAKYKVTDIPKVVGGIDDPATTIAASLYRTIIRSVHPVKDARTAEAVKMMENVFRNVNIALVNEMSLIFERMGIDTWEVIEAAKTKPFGFMPFYPGPGIGGHCIPLDPMYMSYIAKRHGYIPRFIEMSSEINQFMRMHAVNLLEEGLGRAGKRPRGATVAVLGLSYKKNISDARETPAVKIIEEILERGCKVKAYDPLVKSLRTGAGQVASSGSLREAATDTDALLFLVDHDEFSKTDLGEVLPLMRGPPVVVDCKNLFDPAPGMIYIGLGKGRA